MTKQENIAVTGTVEFSLTTLEVTRMMFGFEAFSLAPAL